MGGGTAKRPSKLLLTAGEWVEVRSQEEILATLDERGRLAGLPFMPEMLQFCGQRFRVGKRADKTCDPAHVPWSIRRVEDCVHLENLRCDGSGHGGCEAGCMIFWREEWLKRAPTHVVSVGSLNSPVNTAFGNKNFCSVESLLASAHTVQASGEVVYSCQATDLRNFTSHMSWWDPRQYLRDLRSGNIENGLGNSSTERLLNFALSVMRVLQAMVISLVRQRGITYPETAGALGKTPNRELDLQPGELVQVLSKEEILATLDQKSKNRGLLFGPEMLHYCGGIYRVLRRVHHIVDENTGKMVHMKAPCIVLEGVACRFSEYYRLCPRAIYHYWREIWLKRVTDIQLSEPSSSQESCEHSENQVLFPIGPR